MQDWTEYSRFVIALFAIMTPFAAIPTFLSLTERQNERDRARIVRTAILTIALLLIISALLGDSILRLIGTSLSSFRVGGGIVLLLMALSMMNARVSPVQQTREEAEEATQMSAIGVVPIGMPLLAGPGSISTVIIQMERDASFAHHAMVISCILLVCALVWGVLALATPIGNRLGRTGLNILNRLFGLLLAAIAVEVIATGLRQLFPGWATG
jgi:multiple antibiotic resistance protein